MRIFTLLLLFLTTTGYGQSLILLKKIITTTNLTNTTGLGSGVNGYKNENDQYYFRASDTGTYDDIWQTDGTTENTIKIESEPAFNLWDRIYFVEEGAFIDTYNDKLLFYKNDDDSMTELVDVDILEFFSPVQFGNGKYLFLVDSADTVMKLWQSDMTSEGTYELGSVGIYSGFNKLYASSYAAVVYNSNAFVDFEAKIYDPGMDTIMMIKDYLSPYKSVNSVTYASIYENYLFLTVEEATGTKHYIFDLISHAFYPSVSLEAVEEFKLSNGQLIIVTERDIARVDLTSLAIIKATYMGNPGGEYLFHEDQLYFQILISGNTYKIARFDLNDYSITTYQDLEIGNNNFNPKMAIHEDQLFFIYRALSAQILKRYDFGSQALIEIDTVSHSTGTLTELIELNGVLLASKNVPEVGHEMYYYDSTTGTLNPFSDIQEIVVSPNPVREELQFQHAGTGDKIVTIYNNLGVVVIDFLTSDNRINVSHLSSGNYFGNIVSEGEVFSIKFVKW